MQVRNAVAGLALGRAAMAAAPSGASPSAPTPTSLHARDDNDRLAAGGLRITLPAVTAQPSYYKIAPHESVTFGWQFTSLSKTPDRLYVMASCQANGNTYPIAPSPSGIPGDATQVTWYPYGYHLDAQAQGLPDLAGATYRLLIFDDKGPDGVPKGGEFQANNMAQFAMYFPQAYTPLADWSCLSCSAGAMLESPSRTLLALLVTAAAVVAAGAIGL